MVTDVKIRGDLSRNEAYEAKIDESGKRTLLDSAFTQTMNHYTLLLVATLCSGSLLAKPLDTRSSAGDAESTNDSPHAKLVEARRKVNDLPEVQSSQAQAKADRALAVKTAAEYKQARAKASESESIYRKLFEENLTKLDPEAAAIQLQERQAFREKMVKARSLKKSSGTKSSSPDAVAKAEDEEDAVDE